ncbi:divergent PAP2 family protein [Peptostreptococcus russellii]|uniref:Acid phosphatase n=1 Tax=Peptostreptococcus russellii TaxID=215200 RepID=A0A1H8EBW0_9FIRM|nr:divergent PAP2 family protein [Peptostreptococcus russellii]MBC2577628.1 divergent PAP2 family protein [Peptostreptococcus russellii]SEN16953.1 hypothetical protein SAMN05216454_10165 [Peptostreptococcus russellii]
MSYVVDFFANKTLWVSVLSCFIAQFLKIFTGEKKVELSRAFISGGMPSSHSSFVSCMSVMIGMKHGFNSDMFAVAAVISCIIMYDASGVRQAVGKQATIINQLVEAWQNKKTTQQEKLKELVGHTPKQVFFGALLGILVGIIFY